MVFCSPICFLALFCLFVLLFYCFQVFLFPFSLLRDQPHCNVFGRTFLKGTELVCVYLFIFTSPFLFHFRDLQTRTTWQFINTSMRWHWNLVQPELTQSSLQVFAAPKSYVPYCYQTVKINTRDQMYWELAVLPFSHHEPLCDLHLIRKKEH